MPTAWPSQYFWRTSHLEGRLTAFQIHLKDEALCHPSQLERDPAGVLPIMWHLMSSIS
jgi:hypothetical protein